MATHGVSSHLRHVVEFYECFLDGLRFMRVDYDGRKRDVSMESSREAAVERICSVIGRLETAPELQLDNVLFVRMENSSALDRGDQYLMSSVGRELMTLSSHTVHHFALVAIMLRSHGMAIDADFGVAPATLRHREQAAAAAA